MVADLLLPVTCSQRAAKWSSLNVEHLGVLSPSHLKLDDFLCGQTQVHEVAVLELGLSDLMGHALCQQRSKKIIITQPKIQNKLTKNTKTKQKTNKTPAEEASRWPLRCRAEAGAVP